MAWAAENVPGGFGDVQTSWAFVGGGLFDPMHVSAFRQMIVCEFDDEDLNAVLQCVESLSRTVPVDGSKGAEGPVLVVPSHDVLAKSWGGWSLLVGARLRIVE